MTLNQLRFLCMASRCDSITKADEDLFVTQPTVSVAIRDLEIEFGVSLFSRKGNQLILTREGEEFYQKANYILQYCNELLGGGLACDQLLFLFPGIVVCPPSGCMVQKAALHGI